MFEYEGLLPETKDVNGGDNFEQRHPFLLVATGTIRIRVKFAPPGPMLSQSRKRQRDLSSGLEVVAGSTVNATSTSSSGYSIRRKCARKSGGPKRRSGRERNFDGTSRDLERKIRAVSSSSLFSHNKLTRQAGPSTSTDGGGVDSDASPLADLMRLTEIFESTYKGLASGDWSLYNTAITTSSPSSPSSLPLTWDTARQYSRARASSTLRGMLTSERISRAGRGRSSGIGLSRRRTSEDAYHFKLYSPSTSSLYGADLSFKDGKSHRILTRTRLQRILQFGVQRPRWTTMALDPTVTTEGGQQLSASSVSYRGGEGTKVQEKEKRDQALASGELPDLSDELIDELREHYEDFHEHRIFLRQTQKNHSGGEGGRRNSSNDWDGACRRMFADELDLIRRYHRTVRASESIMLALADILGRPVASIAEVWLVCEERTPKGLWSLHLPMKAREKRRNNNTKKKKEGGKDHGEINRQRRLIKQRRKNSGTCNGGDNTREANSIRGRGRGGGRGGGSSIFGHAEENSALSEALKASLSIEIDRHGENHPIVARSRMHLALALHAVQNYEGALKYLQEVAVFEENAARRGGSGGELTAGAVFGFGGARMMIGNLYMEMGEFEKARQTFEKIVPYGFASQRGDESSGNKKKKTEKTKKTKKRKASKRGGHQGVDTRSNLDGEGGSEEIHAVQQQRPHPAIGVALANMGAACFEMGEIKRGRQHLEEAVSVFNAVLGNSHLYTKISSTFLASLSEEFPPEREQEGGVGAEKMEEEGEEINKGKKSSVTGTPSSSPSTNENISKSTVTSTTEGRGGSNDESKQPKSAHIDEETNDGKDKKDKSNTNDADDSTTAMSNIHRGEQHLSKETRKQQQPTKKNVGTVGGKQKEGHHCNKENQQDRRRSTEGGGTELEARIQAKVERVLIDV
eukprot:jgi/Bigna1/69037/fgenesh1_pg.7_\